MALQLMEMLPKKKRQNFAVLRFLNNLNEDVVLTFRYFPIIAGTLHLAILG